MEYTDIGHSDPEAIVWLFENGRIQGVKASSGTHNSIWGMRALGNWRGRFESDTRRVSVAPPAALMWTAEEPPPELLTVLQRHFGNGITVYLFSSAANGVQFTLS